VKVPRERLLPTLSVLLTIGRVSAAPGSIPGSFGRIMTDFGPVAVRAGERMIGDWLARLEVIQP
jgi:hypothetical protein